MKTINIKGVEFQAKEIKSLNGEPISNWSSFRSIAKEDGQGSGTFEGIVVIDGVNLYVRKHWSNSDAAVAPVDAEMDSIGALRYMDGKLYYAAKWW